MLPSNASDRWPIADAEVDAARPDLTTAREHLDTARHHIALVRPTTPRDRWQPAHPRG